MSDVGSRTGKELYEFGPFRVDPDKEILLRASEPVPLTPKTFQILLVLVRHSKEVVTKDDLMKAVWPDTFVEETNLTRNVFALRKALGESEQARYIITVPGRGYRFAEDVRLVPGQGQGVNLVTASRARVQVQVKETRLRRWMVFVAILLLALAAGAFRLLQPHKPALTGKDTIVLADFANSTGDSVFDGALRQGLSVQLEQSPFLRIVSDEKIRRTFRLMGRPADAVLKDGLAREVCVRTGSAAVLEGSISRLGSQYVLGLRATNCQTGDVLDEEQTQATKEEDVLSALSQIARRFRIRVGESLATVAKHDTPLAEATTPSVEALKAYSEAWKVAWTRGSASAAPLVKHAIEIDPKFAMAYAYLGRLYGDMGESGLARDNLTQAYELRDRVSDREKFFITAIYNRLVTGNMTKAREICELWAQSYPRDTLPPSFLAGGISSAAGEYEKGAEEAQKTIELDPDFPWGYINLAFNGVSLGRWKQAESPLEQLSDRKLALPEVLIARYNIAFLEGDRAGMERVAVVSKGKTGAEDWITDKEAYALAYSGRLREARSMTRRAEDLAREAGESERAAQYEAAEAVREALFGNAFEARRSAMAALALSKGRDVEYGASIALARSGESSVSQKLASELEKRFPEDTLVKFAYLPTLHALLALNDRNPSKAIELLQAASPYDLGASPDSVGFSGALYPVYVRGEAYLAAHEGAEAAAEFQKILNHPGIVLSDPIGALAHSQFGRACALSEDKTKAKSGYQDFLALWKDADPNIPILKQAKAECAKIQ